MIVAFIPSVACDNTLPLLTPDSLAAGDSLPPQKRETLPSYSCFAPPLVANLNPFVLDFVTRQKVQSQHLNFYIVEQLPFVPLEGFARRFGGKSVEQIVREDVLRLTYTARDMAGFVCPRTPPPGPLPQGEGEGGVGDLVDLGLVLDCRASAAMTAERASARMCGCRGPRGGEGDRGYARFLAESHLLWGRGLTSGTIRRHQALGMTEQA
jgi:hypothetical protein